MASIDHSILQVVVAHLRLGQAFLALILDRSPNSHDFVVERHQVFESGQDERHISIMIFPVLSEPPICLKAPLPNMAKK